MTNIAFPTSKLVTSDWGMERGREEIEFGSAVLHDDNDKSDSFPARDTIGC